MGTQLITFDPADPEASFIRCREVITGGGVMAYPTDTYYGLGVDPRNAAAVRRLFEAKERREDQPVLLLLSSSDEVPRWAADVPLAAQRLMDRFWPGPLTLILTATTGVLPELTAGTGSIGLRVPGSKATRGLLEFLGMGLTGTSANRSGGRNPANADEVLRQLGGRIDLVLDAGPAPGGPPSTVLDVRVVPPLLVREGAVTMEMLTG